MTVHCPSCNVNLEPDVPAIGDVWLSVSDGVLYRVDELDSSKPWTGVIRCWPPFNNSLNFDPTRHRLALWPDDVRRGKWVRVNTPLDKAAQQPDSLAELQAVGGMPYSTVTVVAESSAPPSPEEPK